MAAPHLTLDDLVAAIAALTPEQRRRLQRRLHTGGIFVAEELLADQNKLAVAPAVMRPARQRKADSDAPAAAPQERTPFAAAIHARPAPSPGKVVVGSPHPEAADSQTMAPLPGQAPDQPIMIVFDGGSRGNPGEGYGSYQLRWPGSQPQVVRLRFGDNMTNNEAEYDTLLAALDAVLKRLRDANVDPSTARLDVRGDSMLVIKQVLGEWKSKDERMEQRRDKVRSRLRSFGEWRLTHHDREQSVRALGH